MYDIIKFAESEWKKYLSLAGASGEVTGKVDEKAFDNRKFNLANAVYDSRFDDAFTVDIKSGVGQITATNERAVLIGVYECLRRIGFTFCFPGKNGESIPTSLCSENVNLHFTHYAEYRHRGVAPCGPKELYSMLDYVDWMPKVGLNTYFREFFSNHLGWKSWYLHEENPYIEQDEDYTLEKGLEYDKKLEERIKERGLIFQTMGHGWNVAVISNDLYNDFTLLPTTVIDYSKVALVNGKRELPHGFVRCANLCLSQKEVRKKIIKLVVDYAKNNPQADVVQVLFGDSVNKVCECENCKEYSLSEWAVQILNDIDDALTAENIGTRIAFGVYNDTLWAPEKIKLNNSDRFIMEFCPISRDYSRSFDETDISERRTIPKYSRNAIKLPVAPEDFIAFYKKWREKYNGEAVWFDYHGYYASRYDISNTEVVSLTVRDIGMYKKMGVDGLISCEFYRNAFPHGFLCYATARALFDGNFNLENEQEMYFDACFSENSDTVRKYLNLVNKTLPLFDYQWYGEIEEYREFFKEPDIDREKFLQLKTVTQNLSKRLSEFSTENVLCATCSKILYFFTLTVDVLCDLFIMKKNGEKQDRLIKKWESLKKTLCKNEKFLLPYCSVDHLLQTAYWFAVYEPKI